MTEDAFEEALAQRQAKRAARRCVNGHRMKRRRSQHLGAWRTCLGCGLIEQIPDLAIVRPIAVSVAVQTSETAPPTHE